MIDMSDRPDIHVRLRALKLLLGHATPPLFFFKEE
jgi:hypothetical protein